MPTMIRWILGLLIVSLVAIVPAVHFRWDYTHRKRLREVTPGKFYRSGEMTADGFRDANALYHFRTIVNLQDEYPDPDLPVNYLGCTTMKESELCRSLGIRYVYLPPDLIPRRQIPARRPRAIDQFLELLDDPASYPVLIHCRAGLHRTGVMTAVYRMEYEGWTPRQALEDLKANGFGEWPCTAANDYITQYILTYQRGLRQKQAVVRGP